MLRCDRSTTYRTLLFGVPVRTPHRSYGAIALCQKPVAGCVFGVLFENFRTQEKQSGETPAAPVGLVLALRIGCALIEGRMLRCDRSTTYRTLLFGVPDQLKGLEAVWGWKLSNSDFREIERVIKETILDPVGLKWLYPTDRITALGKGA